MNLFIKVPVIVAILVCCLPAILAQSLPDSTPKDGPCGDPSLESSAWTTVEGQVVKVIDGDTVTISLANKKHVLVHLVGIDAPALDQPFGSDAQQFVQNLIGSKKVEVWINPDYRLFSGPGSGEITGVMYVLGVERQDVNLSLIGAGLARKTKPVQYSMSNFTECRYQIADDEARLARKGLWRDEPVG